MRLFVGIGTDPTPQFRRAFAHHSLANEESGRDEHERLAPYAKRMATCTCDSDAISEKPGVVIRVALMRARLDTSGELRNCARYTGTERRRPG